MKAWKVRPFSWSQLSSFEYDPEQWYKNYFLGQRSDPSAEMEFGKVFAQSVEDGKPIVDVPTQNAVEYPFKVKYGKIILVGFADSFCTLTKKKLEEYKTGKRAWDQKRADGHGQIDMYLLMNYITHKVRPEEVECRIHWIPTQDNGDFSISFVKPVRVHSFPTKRTMQDILRFGQRINDTISLMEKYARQHN